MAFQVRPTRKEAPVRAVMYGGGGIGKSTLASQAPGAIFVASEEGLENIDATAIEPYPKRWEDLLEALDHIGSLGPAYQSVAIDSLDWIEPLVWDYVVRTGPKKYKTIEDFGYGKGYIAALDHWRVFLHKLSALRAKGMNVILIAHAIRKTFKNPLGEDFEFWTLKLHEKASGLIVEWVDVVGYCAEDIAVDESSGRGKGQTTGRRVIRTNPHPGHLSKTRYVMPPKINLDWQSFASAVREGGPAAIVRLRSEVESRIRELADDEVEVKVRAFMQERGETSAALAEALERLNITLSERGLAQQG